MGENHVSLFPLSRLCRLIFGTLYPAYYSYKAVKSKDIKEYVSEASRGGRGWLSVNGGGTYLLVWVCGRRETIALLM